MELALKKARCTGACAITRPTQSPDKQNAISSTNCAGKSVYDFEGGQAVTSSPFVAGMLPLFLDTGELRAGDTIDNRSAHNLLAPCDPFSS